MGPQRLCSRFRSLAHFPAGPVLYRYLGLVSLDVCLPISYTLLHWDHSQFSPPTLTAQCLQQKPTAKCIQPLTMYTITDNVYNHWQCIQPLTITKTSICLYTLSPSSDHNTTYPLYSRFHLSNEAHQTRSRGTGAVGRVQSWRGPQ